jgi:hypothetical protein
LKRNQTEGVIGRIEENPDQRGDGELGDGGETEPKGLERLALGRKRPKGEKGREMKV